MYNLDRRIRCSMLFLIVLIPLFASKIYSADTEPQKLSIIFQVGDQEYVDNNDPHVNFIQRQHLIIQSTINSLEKLYPNSKYGVAVHKTSSSEQCGVLYNPAPANKFQMPNIYLKSPLQDKNKCNIYSFVLNTAMQVHRYFLNETMYLPLNKDEHRILIIMTNFWDDWNDPQYHPQCDSIMPMTLQQAMEREYIFMGMLVSDDVYCSWQNMYDDLGYNQKYLVPMEYDKVEDQILTLINSLVKKSMNTARNHPSTIPALIISDISGAYRMTVDTFILWAIGLFTYIYIYIT